eukprot:scaffold11_cov257-Pinguiococcus_pyrenoidosus.AAC.47
MLIPNLSTSPAIKEHLHHVAVAPLASVVEGRVAFAPARGDLRIDVRAFVQQVHGDVQLGRADCCGQRGRASAVDGFNDGSSFHQPLHRLQVPDQGLDVQARLATPFESGSVCTLAKQQPHHVSFPPPGCQIQRRPPADALGFLVRAMVKQQ